MKSIIKYLFLYLGVNIITSCILLIPSIIALISMDEALRNAEIMKVSLLSGILSWFILFTILVKKKKIVINREIFFKNCSFLSTLVLIPMSLGCVYISLTIQSLLDLPDTSGETLLSAATSPIGIISVVVMAPIFEELFFRGVIMTKLMERSTPWQSIIGSALIFGIIHFNPAQVFNAFLLGILLGWIYYKTESLWASITIHFINNGIAVLFINLFPTRVEESIIELSGGIPQFIALFVISVAIIALGIYYFNRNAKEKPLLMEE
ncbi:MAG: type II CAAX endopeptidase family protein [Bacteroidales bacterium]